MGKRYDQANSGPGQRQLRVGELIRRAVAEVLQRGDLHDPDLSGVSVTVGEVQPSNDLKIAVIHVLPLGGQNADVVVKALNRSSPEIRRIVNKSVSLKFSPELKFVVDTTFENLDETRRLLSQDQVVKDIAAPDE